MEMATDTVIVKINPSGDAVVQLLVTEVQGLLAYAKRRVVDSDEAVKLATEDLSLMSNLKKAIETKRKEYLGPIKQQLDLITDAFKAVVDPLQEADKITRDKVLAYRGEQQRKAREAEEINRLRMEAARKEMELKGELTESVGLVEIPPAPVAHVRTEVGTLGTSKVWHFEVVDFAKLPDQYKQADMVKIRKVIMAGATIEGVRAWQEEALRITPR